MPQLRKKLAVKPPKRATKKAVAPPPAAVRFLKVDVGTEFDNLGHSYRVTRITDSEVISELIGEAGSPLTLPRIVIETPAHEDPMTQLSSMLPVNNLPMKKTGKKKKR